MSDTKEAAAPAPAANKKDKNRTPRTAAALYLIKGAAAQVIDSILMIGSSYEAANKGMTGWPKWFFIFSHFTQP